MTITPTLYPITTVHGADNVEKSGTNWVGKIQLRMDEEQREDWLYTLRRDADIGESIAVDATGGTFTITVAGVETAAIAFDATAAEVETAVELLSTVADGDLVVTGGPGDAGGTTPYVITYQRTGALYGTNVPVVTTDPASLTGGAGTAVVTAVTSGN